jgi:histidine triad (HIT) family protein
MSWIVPVDRLEETDLVVAFHHPRPSYPVHVLIVPKRSVRSFTALTPDDMPAVTDAITVAGRLAQRLGLEQAGYRVLVNGGAYQDVQQLHFHLISGASTQE